MGLGWVGSGGWAPWGACFHGGQASPKFFKGVGAPHGVHSQFFCIPHRVPCCHCELVWRWADSESHRIKKNVNECVYNLFGLLKNSELVLEWFGSPRHSQIPHASIFTHHRSDGLFQTSKRQHCDSCRSSEVLDQALVSEPGFLQVSYLLVDNWATLCSITWEKCFLITYDSYSKFEEIIVR